MCKDCKDILYTFVNFRPNQTEISNTRELNIPSAIIHIYIYKKTKSFKLNPERFIKTLVTRVEIEDDFQTVIFTIVVKVSERKQCP